MLVRTSRSDFIFNICSFFASSFIDFIEDIEFATYVCEREFEFFSCINGFVKSTPFRGEGLSTLYRLIGRCRIRRHHIVIIVTI